MSILGVVICSGGVAIQFKVSSTLMQMLFGFSSFYATLISSIVVVFYSTLGGIRAVTFTDIIQFLAFSIVIPIVTFAIWKNFNNYTSISTVLSNKSLFDYKEVFNYKNSNFFSNLSIFLFFILPNMYPSTFQRISMAKNSNQAVKAFLIAGVLCFMIELLICWIGVLLLATDSNLDPNNLIDFLLKNYPNLGFKGFIIAGIMAMVMSTSDSYINSASVMFAHDFSKYFNIISRKNELFLSRIFTIFIGIIAFILALKSKTILGLIMLTFGLYNSVLTVPFLFAVLGFRSSNKSFLIATISAITTFILWKIYFETSSTLDSAIPGMLANLIALFGSHYLLKQPGGWVGIQDGGKFAKLQQEKKRKWQERIENIKQFNFIKFCQKHKPDSEATYPLFGLFAMFINYITMFSMQEAAKSEYMAIIKIIFPLAIIISAIFITYPLWPDKLKNN